MRFYKTTVFTLLSFTYNTFLSYRILRMFSFSVVIFTCNGILFVDAPSTSIAEHPMKSIISFLETLYDR